MNDRHLPSLVLEPPVRSELVRLIERHAGLRLSPEQMQGLERAAGELLADTSYQGPEQLVAAFARGEEGGLLDDLAARLTIGETHFFRIQPQIEALRGRILPDLIRRNSATRRLNIWSAGCSSGEEPYTIAILLREALPAIEGWDIQIWGTDLSQAALARARAAEYREWSFRDTPLYVRQRYFTAVDHRWRLNDPIRSMVRFVRKNLVAPDLVPPGGGVFDLILCRNVTIYFSVETTQRLYRRFAGALVPGGWLVLGPSDPPPDPDTNLAVMSLPGVILWNRPEIAQIVHTQPVTASQQPRSRQTPAGRQPVHGPAPRLPPRAATAGERTRPVDRSPVEPPQPLDAAHHLEQGMILLEQGQTNRAVESLRRATFLEPQHIVAHFSLGRAYQRLGDRARARAALIHTRRLLAAMPGDAVVPGGDELSANRFRHAVDILIEAIDRADG